MTEKEEKGTLSKAPNILGTRPYVQSGQVLISSGIPSLDELVGGGLPVGSVVLLQEDRYSTYSKVMFKYFLAEGVLNKHSIFLASQDVSTENILRELPTPTNTDPEPDQDDKDEKLKIAFMYENVPKGEKSKELTFGHYYDLTKNMDPEILEKADVSHWTTPLDTNAPETFTNTAYHHLLQSIRDKLKEQKYDAANTSEESTVLRIGIQSLGSPMWQLNDVPHLLKQDRDLDMFIFCLRAIIRSHLAVAVVTIPTHLVNEIALSRCVYSSDLAFKLEAFQGTELEENPALAGHHGYFRVLKVAPVNSFVSKHPGSVEHTFKLRKKKFSIETLHLPPDLGDSDNKAPTLSCAVGGGGDKQLLDF